MNRILKTHPVRKKIRGCDLAEKKGEQKGGEGKLCGLGFLGLLYSKICAGFLS
jgi:hypothetical protein